MSTALCPNCPGPSIVTKALAICADGAVFRLFWREPTSSSKPQTGTSRRLFEEIWPFSGEPPSVPFIDIGDNPTWVSLWPNQEPPQKCIFEVVHVPENTTQVPGCRKMLALELMVTANLICMYNILAACISGGKHVPSNAASCIR